MDRRRALIASHHGLVRTRELLAIGEDPEWLRMGRNYGALVHVRRGWWALPGVHPHVLAAWRAGGRLACVSALAFHGVVVHPTQHLHVDLPANSTGPREAGVVVHWSTDQGNGDRRAVSVEVAWQQANRCRVANGSL